MKTLILLRHSKSSWDDPRMADIDRPLNQRGYRESREIAQYIKEKAYKPDIILCSTAKRTRESLKAVIEAINYQGKVEYLDSIYESTWTNLRDEVQKRGEDIVMLVGHSPGIEDYLSNILGEYTPMKTSQLAVVSVESGKLLDYIRPKELI